MAFWNCQTLRESAYVTESGPDAGQLGVRGDVGKLAMLCYALEQRGIQACGLAEHRLEGDACEELHGGWWLLRTGTGATTGPGYLGGVGLLLAPAAARRWRRHGGDVQLVSGNLMSCTLPLDGGEELTLVVFRWPPLKSNAERREETIRRTQQLVAGIGGRKPVLLLGDANGDPGSEAMPGVTGGQGQGTLSDGGEQLLEFASELKLRVMGTYFPKPEGKAHTWQHPLYKTWHTLDHALTRSRHACWVVDVDTKQLAECKSDHRLVQVTLNPARGRGGHARRGQRRQQTGTRRHAVDRLRDDGTRRAFADAVTAGVQGMTPASQSAADLGEAERELVRALRSAADAVLGPAPRRPRLAWQTQHADVIRAMAVARTELQDRPGLSDAERREAMKKLRGEQQREIRRLIAAWWEQRIAHTFQDGIPSKRKLEQAEQEAGLAPRTRGGAGELLDRDGKPLCGHDARLQRWREHFASLFAEESAADLGYIRRETPQRKVQAHLDAAPTRAEYRAAVQGLNLRKAAGEDGVVAELLRSGGEAFHDLFYDLVTVTWERGEVPAAWRDATMVPLPKAKGDLRLCDSWRGISLLSVPGKILAKIVATRLSALAESILHESACGFRPARGTTDCVAVVRALLDHVAASEAGTLHCVFVDLRKAFDKVHRQGLWTTLERQGVPPKLLQVTRALHEGMQARVRVDGATSEPFPVRTGVRQGCLMAPTLLNLFYAAALDAWRRGVDDDIVLRFRIGASLQSTAAAVAQQAAEGGFRAEDRTAIHDTIYADDTTILASSWETAKHKWRRYVDVVGRFGLSIAYAKTKVMTAGRDDTGGDRLAADPAKQHATGPWLRLEHVDQFCLLGSTTQADGGYKQEVASRLKSAGAAYARLRPVCFSGRHLSGRLKYRVYRTFVLTRLLYGAELWRMPWEELSRLERFHNRCLRTIAGHNRWTMYQKHVSDADIRRWLGARPLMELVDRACLRWFGHVARMSAARLPLQLLRGEVTAWPAHPDTLGGRKNWHRHTHRVLRALRHYGIDDRIAMDAAQDAARWRGRINGGGWAQRTTGPREWIRIHEGGKSEIPPPPDCWPRPSDFQHVRQRRCPQDLECEHCGYKTAYHAWMAMHTERCHKSPSGGGRGGGRDDDDKMEDDTKRSGPGRAPEGQSQAASSLGRGAGSQTHVAGRKAGEIARTETTRSGSSPVPGRQSRKAGPHGTEAGPQTHPTSSRKAEHAGARAPTPPPLAAKRRRGDARSGPSPDPEGQSQAAGSREAGAGSQTHAAGRKPGGASVSSRHDAPRSGSSPVSGRQSRKASPQGTKPGPQTHPASSRKADREDAARVTAPPLAAKRRRGEARDPPPTAYAPGAPAAAGAAASAPPRSAKRTRGETPAPRGEAPAAKKRRDVTAAAPDGSPQPLPPEDPQKSGQPQHGEAKEGTTASRSGRNPDPAPKPRSGIG